MKKLLSILSVLVCFTSFSQTPYVPNNPDSLKLSVIVNNAIRSVLVADLTRNKVNTTKHSADSTALKLDIASRLKYVSVSTYASMLSSGIPQTPTIFKVSSDEKNNPGRASIYEYWPDGDVIWIAGQKVN